MAILTGAPADFRAAIALGLSGERVGEVLGTDASRIDLALRLAFAREPTAAEQQKLQEFLAAAINERLGDNAATAASGLRQEAERAAWNQVALVLLNSNEFLFVH